MASSDFQGMDRRIEKKFWTKRRLVYVICFGLCSFIFAYGFSTLSGSTFRIESGRLTISEVTEGEFQEFISVVAIVTPLETYYLDAVEGGTVAEVVAEEGVMLKAGDPILRLENTDVRLDIMYREAQLYEQINNLRNTRIMMEQRKLQLNAELLDIDHMIKESRRQYRVAATLYDKGFTSASEFQQIKDEFDFWSNKQQLTLETQRQDSVLRSQQVEQLEASVARMESNLDFYFSNVI